MSECDFDMDSVSNMDLVEYIRILWQDHLARHITFQMVAWEYNKNERTLWSACRSVYGVNLSLKWARGFENRHLDTLKRGVPKSSSPPFVHGMILLASQINLLNSEWGTWGG